MGKNKGLLFTSVGSLFMIIGFILNKNNQSTISIIIFIVSAILNSIGIFIIGMEQKRNPNNGK